MPAYFATKEGLRSSDQLAQASVGRTAPGGDLSFEAREDSRTRSVIDERLVSSLTLDAGEVIEFEELGIGKPLTIEIRRVYTGEHPKAGAFAFPKHDLLVTLAIRDLATFNRAARAINFLRQEVGWKTTMTNPAAIEEGTPLVYYTKAVAGENLILTLEMGFDEFRAEYFTALSNAFAAAGNLPVFAAASGHLLTAGLATKIVSTVLDRVLNLGPVFTGTFEIPWSRAGKSLRKANLAVLFDHRSAGALSESHTLNDDGALVDKVTSEEYDGLEPYMVISLDGRKNTGLEKFAPTALTAALLDQFYGDNNDREQALQPLVDALALYNDWMFRERTLDLAKEIKETPEGPDRDALQQLYDAAISNIQNDILKPKKAS